MDAATYRVLLFISKVSVRGFKRVYCRVHGNFVLNL